MLGALTEDKWRELKKDWKRKQFNEIQDSISEGKKSRPQAVNEQNTLLKAGMSIKGDSEQ